MTQDVKEFLEKNIELIQLNNFDEFFRRAETEFIPQTTNQIAFILETASIDAMKHLSYIPEGFFMFSRATAFTTPETITEIHFKAFSNADIETLHVTSNCNDVQESAFEGCGFLEKVIIDEDVSFIGDAAFYACDELTYVILPKSLISIGHNVFCSCDKLTEIHYNGTTSDWYDVNRYEFINEGSYIRKVICSDGLIEL